MRKTLFAVLASTGLMIGAGASANAGLLQPLVAGAADAPQLTLASGGCGFGAHRGYYGGCRANRFFRYRRYRHGYFHNF